MHAIVGAQQTTDQAIGLADMNAHLTERFQSIRMDPSVPDLDIAPLAIPSRINDDIWKYCEDTSRSVNAGSWINKPENPTPQELLAPPGFAIGEQVIELDEKLEPNRVEGSYESNEHYLRTQYNLLREDAIRPLRQAIQEVRNDPWRDESAYPSSSGIGIYEPVYLKSVVFSFRGLSAKVAFSLSRVKKLIRWNQSKRLITGTLVALSPADDAFQDVGKCLLAIVGARPLSALESNNPPEIDLFFVQPDHYDWDPARKWIMVESRSSFFEASRHTLLALQHLMREPFPLSEHLVMTRKEIDPPEYIRLNPHVDLGPLVSLEDADRFRDIDVLKEWPDSKNLFLDKSQSEAMRRMMTKKLAIVQGPPGTGKTFVSVVALQTMLQNTRQDDPPIIVACQTNHALDQILRHIADFEPQFVRLGGQTKDQDKIKRRTLYEVRATFQQPRLPGSRKNRAMARMRQLTVKMRALLAPWEAGKPLIGQKYLAQLGLLTGKQASSLDYGLQSVMGIPQSSPEAQMELWLGRSIERWEHPYRPDDFGMPYEEDDFDELEQLQELEAEAVARDDDDDIEALRGPEARLSDNWRGLMGGSLKTAADIRRKLEETEDLTTVPVPDRGAIYNHLVREAKQIILREFRDLSKQYTEQVRLKKIGQWEEDQGILLQQRVIGMTTTGLSKYRALISSLRPRVVLIEEAAETLEAPVTAACFPTLEHLILVGDHQQLRPHCNLREFEDKPYNLNLSLFERLVGNGVELDTLKRQRRMIPEIRRLLHPIYGDKLRDHSSVARADNRPDVEGMGGANSFFFTHEWPESRDNNQSVKNEKEALMIVGFFDYLVLNGVDPAKITVLTFYNGQRKLLTSRLRNHPNLRGQPLKVVTVDSYQGEENDIVLLSLVRSSQEGNIGFLSVDNRVCVALSRAKRGFYLFGNAEKLAISSYTWEAVVKVLWGHGASRDIPSTGPEKRIGYNLPLTCQMHGNKIFVEDPSDWERLNGGCLEICQCRLPCGHSCLLTCHPFDNTRINCMQQCQKPCSNCGQACSQICSDACRCTYCDRRSGGMKAMIKPLQSPTTSMMQQSLAIASFPPITTGALQNTIPEVDTKTRQKMYKGAAEFQELIPTGGSPTSIQPSSDILIPISPPKKPISRSANTSLLVDLFDEPAPSSCSSPSRRSYKEKFAYGSDTPGTPGEENQQDKKAAQRQVPAPVLNLLD